MSVPTMRPTLRLGTRASTLAKIQSGLVADAISGSVELIEISTTGDRSRAPVTELGGTGVFVSALRDALLAGDIDLAVHSYKDLPTAPAPGLTLAAVPEREDPRDALVARDGLRLDELPTGARVGTGAPRRVAQLRAARPDLELVAIRGNVDTRLRMVTEGRLDAVVVAMAGLSRLGRTNVVTEPLDPTLLLPAPAQGALAIECRDDDLDLVARLTELDHPASRAAVTAERALLATLEAGCSAPLGALAENKDDTLVLRGVVASLDGTTAVRREATGSITDAARLGHGLATELLAAGVSDLLGSSR
ncbi:MAG TPA: hydroxymethylbilane synthase [Mycobacteriales bacterium]|jgi:hydroxymethylbilane synthase|nr:hydroxymethylbilane synthase [Mycobacteriales bacterium]